MSYWVTFLDDKGKPCLRGPYHSEGRAQEKVDKLDREGSIISLPTSNPDTATRMLKERRLDGLGVTEGTKNFRHRGLSEYEI